MHSFRFRYVVLGLLTYIQSAFSRTCVCDFDDIPSLTVRADIIFEGRAYLEVVSPSRSPSKQDSSYLVQFRIVQMLKGKFETNESYLKKEDQIVSVGEFGHESNREDCVAPKVKLDSAYIVFLQSDNESTNSRTDSLSILNSNNASLNRSPYSDSSRNITAAVSPAYRISAFPIAVSDRALADVRANSCKKCGK